MKGISKFTIFLLWNGMAIKGDCQQLMLHMGILKSF